MRSEEHFINEFITVHFDGPSSAAVARWLVPPTSSEFREGLELMLTFMKKFHTGKLVVDTTHLGAIHEDDQTWAASDWYDKAIAIGYCKIAMILPTDIFTQMSVENTMASVKENVVSTAYFDTLEAALQWIK